MAVTGSVPFDLAPIVSPNRTLFELLQKVSTESRAVAYSVMPYYHYIYGALTGRTRKSSRPARGPSGTRNLVARSRPDGNPFVK